MRNDPRIEIVILRASLFPFSISNSLSISTLHFCPVDSMLPISGPIECHFTCAMPYECI